MPTAVKHAFHKNAYCRNFLKFPFADNADRREVLFFEPRSAKYIRLVAISAYGDGDTAAPITSPA